MKYSYTITLAPYDDKQFNDAQQFGRALHILADKFVYEKVVMPRYREINNIGHGRVLDAKFENLDIPSFSWVVSVNDH